MLCSVTHCAGCVSTNIALFYLGVWFIDCLCMCTQCSTYIVPLHTYSSVQGHGKGHVRIVKELANWSCRRESNQHHYHYCRVGSEANNHAVWSQISVLSVMLRNAIYSDTRRITRYKVEMESDTERRRLTRIPVQRHHWAEDDSRRQQWWEADQRWYYCHNLICAYISQPLVVTASDSVAALLRFIVNLWVQRQHWAERDSWRQQQWEAVRK